MSTPSRRRPFLAPALVALAVSLLGANPGRAEFLVGTFEDQNPGTDSFRNDFRPEESFQTGEFTLNNDYNATYGSWSGFAVSSRLDNNFGGLSYHHLYGAYAPAVNDLTGSDGSATYAVAYQSALSTTYINLPDKASAVSIDLTNTTYAAQSIVEGDSFARAFVKGDYFLLKILGYSGLNGTGGLLDTVEYYLADFRGDSLLLTGDWTTVDLSTLAEARSLVFEFESTDVGQYGMNTPATVAIDNLVAFRQGPTPPAVPEPSSVLLLGLGLGGLVLHHRRRR